MGQMYYKTSSGALVPITGATNDPTKVSLSGTDTISGAKTFTGTVTLPAGSVTSANIKGEAWTSYTPTLTASTTNPTNWTASGSYVQVGKLVIAKFNVTAGASMTAGSGFYRITFPVAATGLYNVIGQVFLFDSSTNNGWTSGVAWHTTASTYFEVIYANGGQNTTVSNSAPWTWAASDYLRGTIVYEAA